MKNALLWVRILSIGSLFIPIFYLHWILLFLEEKIKEVKKVILALGYFVTFFILIFSFTDHFIAGIRPLIDFKYWPMPGFLYTIYIVIGYIGLVGYGFVNLIIAFKNSKGVKKHQIKYIIIGTILGFFGGATNFFLWYEVPIYPFGNFLVSFYTFFLAYSIVAHRLMDIRFVMRKWSVLGFSLLAMGFLAAGIKFVAGRYLPGLGVWADLFILIVGIMFFPRLKNHFYYLANKYFFTSLYDAGKIISDLGENLKSTIEIKKVYGFLFETLNRAMHIREFAFLELSSGGEYELKYGQNISSGHDLRIKTDSAAHKNLFSAGRSAVISEFRREDREMEDLKAFKKCGFEVVTPLNAKGRTIGLMAIGKKESGDSFNGGDIQVIEIIGTQAAISIENALLYEKAVKFNIELQKEVDAATRELNQVHKKLLRLDAAKSQFMSIASHQLRTPLTVIKGYISMLLEKNFGTVNEKQADSLVKVYDSNERLIQLVENLLNISRIESGGLQYYYEDISLKKLLDGVVDELAGVARKKGLVFDYQASGNLPNLRLDEEKIRQVLLNLIENALKYTKKGKVSVRLGKKGADIRFSVKDSGIGITPADMPNLFKKFSRGTSLSMAHMEGTGLGLYVVRNVIEAHNGKVWAESGGEGKGSEFIFTLPAASPLEIKYEEKNTYSGRRGVFAGNV